MKTFACAAAAALIGAAALVAPPSQAAGPMPPALTGESLFDGSTPELSNVDCDPTGQTIEFDTSGPAGGPYPGTFTEHITVVLGPQDNPPLGTRPGDSTSWVESFEATFTIHSGDTTIHGTKTLIDTGGVHYPGSNFGICFSDAAFPSPGNPGFLYTRFLTFEVGLGYEATIETPSGTFTDTGRATSQYTDQVERIDDDLDGDYDRTFSSSGGSELFYLSDGVTANDNPPAAVSLSPVAATNPVGTSHTVTATVSTADGQPSAAAAVLFAVRGSTTTSGSCTTAADGTCSFTYQGPDLPGADSITACADNDADGACGPLEPQGEATKAWVLPTSTPGHVTGGGQVPDLSDRNRKVAFGFDAQDTRTGFKGSCSVVDQSPARNLLIKCLDVTALVQAGTHATFFGNAQVNGTPTTYRIDVDDLAEPGKGADTFKIHTDSGYTASGVLSQGNIQVHQP